MEIRTPFAVFTGEAPAGVPECVNTIPFSIARDGARTMIEGEGSVNCHFEQKPEGAPHTILEYDAVPNGELLSATSDKPLWWLDGTIVQYYTGYPPEAINPCPESRPCRTPSSDVVPLSFAHEDGSTVTVPSTFIPHLRSSESQGRMGRGHVSANWRLRPTARRKVTT